MVRSPVRWLLRRRFTLNFEMPDNRILFFEILRELRLCRSLDVMLNPSDAIEHFTQKDVWGARRGR